MKYKWLFIVIAPLIAILMAGARWYYLASVWEYKGEPVVFEIRVGEPFSSINGRLANKKLISSPKIFYHYSKFNNLLRKFKSGRYVIDTNSNMLDIIDALVKGNSISVPVTIVEGKNVYEISKVLEAKGVTSGSDFLELSLNQAFVKALSLPGNRLEGYLYPDTYNFTPGTRPKDVIKTMVNLFNRRTKDLDFSNELGLNRHQIIILASIVEKETGNPDERARIAGVFVNRLKRRMRLQSDPTTIYGIFETYNGNLRKKHLLKHTPYNTYKINGLPVGPISNPGLASIKAVLNPESHNFLYFVSQNNGEHVFSKSYKEHLVAVNKFQKSRAMRVGRSWRDLKKKRAKSAKK